jgi:cell division protein FtsI (penicillin-binding protein 3)
MNTPRRPRKVTASRAEVFKVLKVSSSISAEQVLASTATRGRYFAYLLVSGFVFFAGAFFWIQIVKHSFWKDYGERRHLRTIEIEGKRGLILDRHQRELAISEPFARLEIEPIQYRRYVEKRYKKTEDLDKLATRLAALSKHINMPLAELQNILASNRAYVVLATDIEPQEAEQIVADFIPTLRTKIYQSRIYPSGEVSAAVVGVFGQKQQMGLDGLEKTYDSVLQGENGDDSYLSDPIGRFLAKRSYKPPRDGRNIVVSLDVRIQQYAYKALSDMVIKSGAQEGALVLMDTFTGELLSMVRFPSVDPNAKLNNESLNRLRNLAVTDIFEPGSTMKPFFAALALDNKLLNINDSFDLNNGHSTVAGLPINDVSPPQKPRSTITDIIIHSSNVGIVKATDRLQRQEMAEMLTKLGFGKPLPISLPGQLSGRVNDYRQWRAFDKATITFGYTMSTNLMQLLRAYTVFARDGEVIQPTLTPTNIKAQGEKIFSTDTIAKMRGMLEKTVIEGSGKKARIEGYRVAGKTGTAKKFVDGAYEKRYLSTFVGYAPASQPRLLMAVMINDPSKDSVVGIHGGHVAAPVFADAMGHALRLLDIPPDAPENIARE